MVYNRIAQRARQRAYRRLVALHAEEFAAIHNEERAKLGLAPPDPAKWQRATLDPEEPVAV